MDSEFSISSRNWLRRARADLRDAAHHIKNGNSARSVAMLWSAVDALAQIEQNNAREHTREVNQAWDNGYRIGLETRNGNHV